MATVAPAARDNVRKSPGRLRDEWTKLRRRRKYLVDSKTQFGITRQFVVVLLAASGLSIGNYHVFRNVLAVEIHDSADAWLAYGYCLLMVGISVGLLTLMCLFFSHRVAGPARKLGQTLAQMANGNLCTHVRLRDNDLLQGLALALNDTCTDLRTALIEVEAEVRRARSLAKHDPNLCASLDRVERIVSRFHLAESYEVDARERLSRDLGQGAARTSG